MERNVQKGSNRMNKHTVTFGHGVQTRKSEHVYPYASCRRGEFGWETSFHKTYAAARRKAGIGGAVRETEIV